MSRLEVVHRTLLDYASPIGETYMELRLRPLDGGGQVVEEYELATVPPAELRSYVDGFGNVTHYFNSVEPHQRVEVVSRSLVRTASEHVIDDHGDFQTTFGQFRGPVIDVPGVRRLAARVRGDGLEARLDFLARLINREFEYRPETTDVFTAVDEVIRIRSGVCQDFAHLFIAVTRALGVPCRYVSGYIHAGAGRQGAGASHAWAEAWVPGRGWLGYDPTNPLRAGEHHVRVATGRDYVDVAPTRGTYVGGASEVMAVEVATRLL